ncbi:MAG: hypothetical protein AB8C40_10550 [Gammaproteobacteria bacterium]
MSNIANNDIKGEWSFLQGQYESYEKFSLLIKLSGVGLISIAYFLDSIDVLIVFVLLVLWMQDAIWKTFQSRIETRLLQIEKFILKAEDGKAYQFNSEYLKKRLRNIELIFEYLQQAVRPTVAFPHCVLIVVSGILIIL